MKKFFKIFGICLGAIALLFIAQLVWTKIRIERGDLIKYENQWYTKEELKKKIPPNYIEVPAKNTPEQVYTAFRQALLDNDIEGALAQIVVGKRDEYRKAFQDKEKFDKWVKRFPEKIIKENEYGNFSSYYYLNNDDNNDRLAHPVNFSKDAYGYWKIEII